MHISKLNAGMLMHSFDYKASSANKTNKDISFKGDFSLQKMWVDKESIKNILQANKIKYSPVTSFNQQLKPKDLVNDNTAILATLKVYDKNIKKDINAILALTKHGREYRVVCVNADNAIDNLNKEDYIAFIKFKVIDKNKLPVFYNGVLEQQTVKSIVESTQRDRDYVTIIGGYANSEPKRYFNAGKKTALAAIQLFKEFGIENIFFGAFPPEGSHSPIPYYMRAKMQLLGCNEDDILSQTNNYKTRLVQTKKIAMMMPQNAEVIELAQHYNLIGEFFKNKI